MELGFTAREARLGMRACQGNMSAAAEYIMKQRQVSAVTMPEMAGAPIFVFLTISIWIYLLLLRLLRLLGICRLPDQGCLGDEWSHLLQLLLAAVVRGVLTGHTSSLVTLWRGHLCRLWINVISHVCSRLAVLHCKNAGHCVQIFQPYFFFTCHAYRHHWLLPLYTTLSGPDACNISCTTA